MHSKVYSICFTVSYIFVLLQTNKTLTIQFPCRILSSTLIILILLFVMIIHSCKLLSSSMLSAYTTLCKYFYIVCLNLYFLKDDDFCRNCLEFSVCFTLIFIHIFSCMLKLLFFNSCKTYLWFYKFYNYQFDSMLFFSALTYMFVIHIILMILCILFTFLVYL